MIFISYNLGCRNCLQSDGIRHTTGLMDADIEDYKDKTEFEVMTLVEEWRSEQGNVCEMCGSNNVEVMDVKVCDYILYDFDNLVERCRVNNEYIIIFNIDKQGSEINLTPGGSQNIDAEFFKSAIQVIIDLINYRPTSIFTPQIKGNFFVCLTGGYDYMKDKAIVRLERFRSSGLTQDEILNAIRHPPEQVGITINQTQQNTIQATNMLDGKKFKGALFNSWFYAESIEHAKNEGYSYANACFDLDDNTIIAYGTEYDESPRDFIDNNQYNDFVVDTAKGPFTINGKTVYYAKKC